MFWDFISLHQVPRSEAEGRLFATALKNMHLVYGNPMWTVVRLVGNPATAVNQTP